MLLPKESFAQWKKVLEVGDSLILDINFLREEGAPLKGIVCISQISGATVTNASYHTFDGGDTWIRQLSPDVYFNSSLVSSAIKDGNTLWLGTGNSTVDELSISHDFGLTYSYIPLTENPNAMYYNHHSGLLLVSGDEGLYSSGDEGMTWKTIVSYTLGDNWYGGYAFVNDSVGMVTGAVGTPPLQPCMFTSDGGVTWRDSVFLDATWQPLGIRNTSTYLIASDRSYNILRSDDFGKTWDTIYNFRSIGLTGAIVGDNCNMFVQADGSATGGIFSSTDGGYSWQKISDKVNYGFSRIFFHNNVLFVADRARAANGNITSLWRYTLPPNKPTMVVDDIVITLPCPTQDTSNIPISFAAVNQCDGDKVVLDTMYITGSPDFIITHDSLGREIVWDTLRVQYEPTDASEDTAFVHFRFKLKGNTFDTVMTILGKGSTARDSLSFLAILTKPSATWAETTELRILPDKAVANKGLAEIRFDVTLDADVLEPLTNYSTGIGGASIQMNPSTQVGKLTRYPFVITGNNMTLDPAVSILNLPMRPYVSDTTITTIQLSTIYFNPQDPDYERCTLSATGDGTPFTLELMCGDSLLSRHLGGKPILTVISLKPNPTKSDVTVTFDLAVSGSVRAEVLDVLGNVVKEETLEARQGETKYNITMDGVAEGVYYVRLRFASETRTVKFIVE